MISDLKTQIFKKLQKANKLFKRKEYFQSLQQYNSIFKIFPKQKSSLEIEDLLFSLYSLRGMNYISIRQYTKAQNDFNFVLNKRPYQCTTLSRRINLYIKLKQYQQALVDLQLLIQLQPDSIRVMALMLEVKEKIEKENQKQQKTEMKKRIQMMTNYTQNQEIDEQELLNFSNLKLIDRKSQLISFTKAKRISQISFKQDQLIQYQKNEIQQSKPTKSKFRISIQDTFNILEQQKKDQENLLSNFNDYPPVKIISKKNNGPKKSILKSNKFSSIIVNTENNQSYNSVSKFKLLSPTSIKDVQGKVISSHSSKEVKFRQSEMPLKPRCTNKLRKSCLKQSSFALKQNSLMNINKNRPIRNSSFTGLNMNAVEGKILANTNYNTQQCDSQNSFDSSNQYNIYGNKEQIELPEEFKSNFKTQNKQNIEKSKSKKSILKKFSVVNKTTTPQKIQVPQRKGKKSVVFRQ